MLEDINITESLSYRLFEITIIGHIRGQREIIQEHAVKYVLMSKELCMLLLLK